MAKTKPTSESLRDVLFNEIQELQKRKGNPQRAMVRGTPIFASEIIEQLTGRNQFDFYPARQHG